MLGNRRRPSGHAHSSASRRRRGIGGLLALALASGTLATVAVVATTASPAQAYTNTTNSRVSGVSCSADNLTSSWGSVTVPANAISATYSITGGGGAGGDDEGAAGGTGGRGGIVNGTFPVTPGQVIWARVGCGAPDATGNAAGYTTGGNATNAGGGGGGSTAICLGSATASCGGGTVWAIAAGGGGGGKAFDQSFTCGSDMAGGAGGGAHGGSTSGGQNGGTGYGGARGGNGGGGSTGGGGGGGIGQGPGWNTGLTSGNNTGGSPGRGDGTGDSGTGGNASGVSPSGSGGNGGNGAGNDGYWGGGGGGGYTGGGGGGRGDDGSGCDNESGAGAGAGSSWARDGHISQSWNVPSDTKVNCSSANIGTSAGQGGARQVGGCDGDAFVYFTLNTPPTGANQSLNATKGVGLGITLAANDTAGEGTPSCTNVTSPGVGTLTGSGCSRTYTAPANSSGSTSFTYQVIDADGALSPTYTITLSIVNRAPTGAAQGPITINKTTPATTINLANTDPDGDSPLTCTVVTAPTKSTLGGSSTSCSRPITGNVNQSGADSFTYRVNDAYGGQSPTYTVSLSIANRAPAGANQSVTVDAGSASAVTLASSDVDGDTLSCTAPVSAPTKGSVSGGSSCSRTYTSNAGTANNGVGGSDSFTYTVSDQNGGTSSPANTVTVNIVNPDLSLAKSHSGRFQPGTGTGTYTLTVGNSATAPANGTTTITDTLPSGMTYRSFNAGTSGFSCSGVAGVSTTVTCTRGTQIPEGFSGSLTITVDVAENAATPADNVAVISSLYELAATAGNNTATDGTVVNRRPTAANVTVGTALDTPVIVGLQGNDLDGDALTYDVVAGPSNGSLSGAGATRQYSPDTGFVGVDTFTYRVTDTDGLQSTVATVTVYVGASKLSGQVTNESGGAPLSGMSVFLIDNANPTATDPVVFGSVTTDALGAYDFASLFPTVGAVPHGDYVVRFVDPARNFISEYHLDSANRAGATNVAVDDTAPTLQIDAALTPGARITGTVRSTASGSPTIDGIQVRLYRIGQSGSRAVTTASGGQYVFDLLAAGDYQLWFRDVNSGQYVSEWYDEQSSQAASTTVNLTVGQQRVINEELAPVVAPEPPTTGTVAGTVRSSLPGNAPIAGIQVRLYSAADGYTASKATTTDGNGQYSFADVTAGSYKLWFRSLNGSAWVSEYYDDEATLASADPFTVGAGTSLIDAQLSPPGGPAAPNTAVVSGKVTELDGVTPIAGIQVRLYVNGVSTGSTATVTDANGNYTFTGRAPGQYQVWFRDVANTTWISEWHLDQPNQASATPVSASNGSTTTVNAQLNYK